MIPTDSVTSKVGDSISLNDPAVTIVPISALHLLKFLIVVDGLTVG